MSNMLSNKAPWDLVAPGYADITMKMFRTYTLAALDLVKPGKQDKIVDIACGPGTTTLEAAALVDSVHALDFSAPMLDILNATIQKENISNIKTHCGDGQQLPYQDEQFDAAFSMFGLMFFPDRAKGYAEIHRVLKPGGKTVISSWTPVADSSGFQLVFGTLQAINPDIPEPQTNIASLENPDFFKAELEHAGFNDVEIHRVIGEIPLNDINQFWNDMVRANAPIAMYKNSMTEEQWSEKNQAALAYLKEKTATMPDKLQAHAWLGVGAK